MLFSQLEEIVHGQVIQCAKDRPLSDLIIDSRKAVASDSALFFAIHGARHDGHTFINALYGQGIRQFVVEKEIACEKLPEANVIRVKSAVAALQLIVRYHRAQIQLPVIGITGSNGKTIIKEWLYQLLSRDCAIVKNPGSYNSQLGVPLSVWSIRPYHQLGIFEAGISTRGEMEKLARIIQPSIGIFSNVGTAHDEGFADIVEKVKEKLVLFQHVDTLVYCYDHTIIHDLVQQAGIPGFSWGTNKNAKVIIHDSEGTYSVKYNDQTFTITLPFQDQASIENCFHCVALMLYMKYSPDIICQRIQTLHSVAMRMELKEGINYCQIIDDSYNNDLEGLQISLDFLTHQQQKKKKRVVLSDMFQSGLNEDALIQRIAGMIERSGVDAFVGIGETLVRHQKLFTIPSSFYISTEAFLEAAPFDAYREEIILIKGARSFQFEKIVHRLQRKVHGTVMEIDLGALVHNLNYFRAGLLANTRIMVMVKAFAYGSGSAEVANVLQYHKVDYLGVAYPDEGLELRHHNITVPIMVMNSSEDSFEQLLAFQLEPEIYNFKILRALIAYLKGRPCKVHIKIDTGMRRLGFETTDMDTLAGLLKANRNIEVASIFTHLAAADEAQHDAFSRQQAETFLRESDKLANALGYTPLRHILNSPGILRLPAWHLDMVRLGIGLYGVDPTDVQADLKPVATLKTIISQIKQVAKGETIGYGRSGKATHDMTIATLAIGYADGFSRAFSNGVGTVLLHGKRAPVIGNVCMDMTMVDITGIPATEGDEAIIFGKNLPLHQIASAIHTIPYEILTSISSRVKRVFVAESI